MEKVILAIIFLCAIGYIAYRIKNLASPSGGSCCSGRDCDGCGQHTVIVPQRDDDLR